MHRENTKDEYDTAPCFIAFSEHFAGIEDYRREASTSHRLIDIIFIALCGAIAGCNNLKSIAEYAKDMEEWFTSFLGLQNGVPSYATFWLVFKHLDPKSLSECFVSWVMSIVRQTGEKTISIDGKALRGTAQPGKPNSFVHIVSAWASQEGLTLGQRKVDGKSNEIKAIPELIKQIDIKGAVVTIDAMGTQKEIANALTLKGADYILALKENQSRLYDEVFNYASQAIHYGDNGIDFFFNEELNEGHGRSECRRIYVIDQIDFIDGIISEWNGFKSIVWIESERTVKGKTTRETRYYITSLAPDAKAIGLFIRSHWGIENKVHWILDVAFREDEQKASAGHIPENMSLIRRIALNMLSKEKSAKIGIELKRQKANRRIDYLLKVLGANLSS